MGCSGKGPVSPSPPEVPPTSRARRAGGSLHSIFDIFSGTAPAGQGDLHPQPCLHHLCGSRAPRGTVTATCRRQDVTSNLKRSCCRGGGRPGCPRGFRGTQCKHRCSAPIRLLPQLPCGAEHPWCPHGDRERPAGQGHDPFAGSVTGEKALVPSGVFLGWWHEGVPLFGVCTAPRAPESTGRWIWQLWDNGLGPCNSLSSRGSVLRPGG